MFTFKVFALQKYFGYAELAMIQWYNAYENEQQRVQLYLEKLYVWENTHG